MSLIGGLLVCNSTSEPVHAEAAHSEENQEDPSVTFSHGKKVYTDYSITGYRGTEDVCFALLLMALVYDQGNLLQMRAFRGN
ncbi:hypothetical protein C3L33_02071, partial [Rhododendron williamsianum]